ncbi:UDP-N-acetylmuramoyl-tripeptide--D-alanyl-D-alanine ligase [Austwickia chelonae]|uniref:UDP-N-acetylmuramoyl-tripeptide--D-alanyl-D-alanine ligase n=1 Tax=Austwickia chelonae NBRC 105200 TaxID=1184607 RepID=K6W3W4_9MICO|nr:UDP-N-acetylmuramoyl-tripeptide--D-alanyl-D-alanine ligase [Austwickia chelonae]GAB76482.1 UDP-N-acetylmuramoyl-tripeptide--D-alanyl-D-alanine ligase [Austwickia chelonae NBRC 105200]SEW25482.1 UDP-N-acetylmuramoyl-tripeptide--D-alanyl-D-alanine ligase [Austwickia chelonae]
MIPLTLSRIAEITGGRLSEGAVGSIVIDGPVVTDSREAGPGSLYIARVGEQTDGHRYVGQAALNGALAALVTAPVDELPFVLVPDVQEAFSSLASAVIDDIAELTVIGVTGSSGKTSTKDLLAAVLGESASTVANIGSLNSEVGVPLTVCRAVPETRHLILEMGARGLGHVKYLTDMTRPRVGVVLNVGSAHVGEFGGIGAITEAKRELVESLPKDGLAVLNADDPRVASMAAHTSARVVLTGRCASADVRAADISMSDQGTASFLLIFPEGEARVDLKVLGEHMVDNCLSVAAVAREVGMDVRQIAGALGRARLSSRWRLERHDRQDGVTVLNDAYNANPDSLAAALRTLAAMGSGRRTWAVIGEMLELGEESESAHRASGALAASLGVDRVIAVGEGAFPVAEGAGAYGRTVADIDEAYELLTAELVQGDIVLLKSSRNSGLRHLGERLAEESQA